MLISVTTFGLLFESNRNICRLFLSNGSYTCEVHPELRERFAFSSVTTICDAAVPVRSHGLCAREFDVSTRAYDFHGRDNEFLYKPVVFGCAQRDSLIPLCKLLEFAPQR